LANPGHPSIGLGYLFYIILRVISYISSEKITRQKKFGRIILPSVLAFMITLLIILIVIILYF